MRIVLTIALTALLALATLLARAQEIRVQGFSQLRKKEVRKNKLKTDKSQATLDFITSEKGFTFKADGKTDLTPQEGEDKITLLVPHKTVYIQIKHPDYGELTWMTPGKKKLRKKKYYQAILLTSSPTKEYKVRKQWVVFYVSPENAILYADSVRYTVRKGEKQIYLPLGKHTFRLEAPFYKEWTDSVTLDEEARANLTVDLQPIYSYLTVNTPMADGVIHLDGDSIGLGRVISNRIMAGKHRLTYTRKSMCYYNDWIDIDSVQKKVITLREKDLKPITIPRGMTMKQLALLPVSEKPYIDDRLMGNVHVKAPDAETEIWIDREMVATGEWDGKLSKGYHILQTRKDGLESDVYPLRIENEWPQEVNLETPQAGWGVVNITSNVVDADVYVDDRKVGQSPLQMQLTADRNYLITLTKDGYKEATAKVLIRGNEMNRVEIKMKKKK